MMIGGYPRAFGELATWATNNNATVDEARHRFAQFAALCGISSIPRLRSALVFKGGNAIDFVWFANRSTRDLDFSFDESGDMVVVDETILRDLLGQATRIATARFGIVFAIHTVRQQPPGGGRTFVTYEGRVGYALLDEPRLIVRMQNGQPSPHVLPIDISINEPICGDTLFTVDEHFPPLRVSTVEDIVSEKLRALLQQPLRNRNRRQDVLDLAVLIRATPDLNEQQVGAFLETKARARGVVVSRTAFRAPEIAGRARLDYDALDATARTMLIPFDDAFAMVLELVDRLDIPETR